MIEHVAVGRGGAYRSHLIEEAVREWYERRFGGVPTTAGASPPAAEPEPEAPRRVKRVVEGEPVRRKKVRRVVKKRRRVRANGNNEET